MKHTIGLFVASLLLAGCASHLSDSNISQKAVGIWTMPHTTAKMDVRDDGSYVTRGESQTATGSWRVEDGCIVAVVTNLSDHASVPVGQPSRYKVVSIDEHQMTFISVGTTNLVTFTKP
jgi:hypothetical protein